MTRQDRRERRVKVTRDSVLFASGLAGVFYETVFDKADRPTLLLLFGAMMGLPAFLRSDEQVRSKVGRKPAPKTPETAPEPAEDAP